MACRALKMPLSSSTALSILYLRPLQGDIQWLLRRQEVPHASAFLWSLQGQKLSSGQNGWEVMSRWLIQSRDSRPLAGSWSALHMLSIPGFRTLSRGFFFPDVVTFICVLQPTKVNLLAMYGQHRCQCCLAWHNHSIVIHCKVLVILLPDW